MARDLSPYSARLQLTRQLAQGKSGAPPLSPRRQASPPAPRNPPNGLTNAPLASAEHRSKSRSNESKERRPRNSSRERRRHRSRDRQKDRHRSKDRHRDRSRERRRDRSGDRKKGHSDGRRRHRSRSTRRDESKDEASRRHGSHSHHRRKDTHRHSPSPPPYRSRHPSASPSPPPKRRRRTRSPSPHARTKHPLPTQELSFRGLDNSAQPPSHYGGIPASKEKPNFQPTGALARAANRVAGTKISLKYHEPPEGRKPPPSQPWRLFVFDGPDVVDTLELAHKSCWLLGRAREVVDYPLDHPSASAQHAALQFRHIVTATTTEDDLAAPLTHRATVKPYIIDLESSNGTQLNGAPLAPSRYVELRHKDILTFAGSEREYVVMLPPAEDR